MTYYERRFYEKLGPKLKAWREKHNKTQTELGKLIGVRQCNLSKIERGTAAIGAFQMQLLSQLGFFYE